MIRCMVLAWLSQVVSEHFSGCSNERCQGAVKVLMSFEVHVYFTLTQRNLKQAAVGARSVLIA